MADVSMAGDGVSMVKFIGAFGLVLTLMLGIAWLLKRAGFAGPVLAVGQKRRLKVIESISVDHRRRLVLVRRDDREHLLLLGPDHASVVETSIPAVSALADQPTTMTATGEASSRASA